MKDNHVNHYYRHGAVSYALTYALNPNKAFRYYPLYHDTSGDCANFLSQCLLSGGAPMKYNKDNEWWYNSSKNSISWSVAHSLYWFLKINNEKNLSGAKGIEVTNANILELGDLIFFEDYKNQIFHSAIVTSFDRNTILISHHSFEALNIPLVKSYMAKKLHYIKIEL